MGTKKEMLAEYRGAKLRIAWPIFKYSLMRSQIIVAAVLAFCAPVTAQVITPVTCRAETTACETANVAAVQGAINSFGPEQGGIVQIADGVPINSTITIANNVTIKGFGWGSSTAPSPSSYIKWFGPSGQPMLLFQTYFGGGAENIRLIGNSSSPPSAAIQLDTLGGRRNMQFGNFDRIYIGEMFGLDSNAFPQFQDGILFTGAINEDTQRFGLIVVEPVIRSGVRNTNDNASAVTFENLVVKGGVNCIWTNAQIVVHMLYCQTTSYNLVIASPGILNIGSFVSESSGGLAQFVNGIAPNLGNYLQSLFIQDGTFQVWSNMVNPVVDIGTSTYWKIILGAMRFTASFCPTAVPIINLANASGVVDGYYRGTITSPGCGVAAGMTNYATGQPAPHYAGEIFDYQIGGTGGPL